MCLQGLWAEEVGAWSCRRRLHTCLQVQSPWTQALGLTVQGPGGRGVTWDTWALPKRTDLRTERAESGRQTCRERDGRKLG